jgi:hypothetical protein
MDVKSVGAAGAAKVAKTSEVRTRPSSSESMVKFERPDKLSESEVRGKLKIEQKKIDDYKQAASAMKAKKEAAAAAQAPAPAVAAAATAVASTAVPPVGAPVAAAIGKLPEAKEAPKEMAKEIPLVVAKEATKEAAKEENKEEVKSDIGVNNPNDPDTKEKLKAFMKSGPALFNDREQQTLKNLLDA